MPHLIVTRLVIILQRIITYRVSFVLVILASSRRVAPQRSPMQIVSVKRRLDAPAAIVWKLVSQGGGVERWLPIIASCRLDGHGPGARRACATVHGHHLDETIETIDHASQIFQYRIDRQDLMPVVDLVGTLHVSEHGAGLAEVLWFLNYELVDAAAAEAVRAGIADIYAAGLAGLERLAREAA
jgi:uncharacterized protein YndB with AHSA1/START domain